jgi:hypothetical protein
MDDPFVSEGKVFLVFFVRDRAEGASSWADACDEEDKLLSPYAILAAFRQGAEVIGIILILF